MAGIALYFAVIIQNLLTTAVFWFVMFWIYKKLPENRKFVKGTTISLLILITIIINLPINGDIALFGVIFSCISALWGILRLVEKGNVKPKTYDTNSLSVIIQILVIFGVSLVALIKGLGFMENIVLIIVIMLIGSDYSVVIGGRSKIGLLIGSIIGLMIVEILWISNFLPISSIILSAFIAFIAISFMQIVQEWNNNKIDVNRIMTRVTVMACVLLLVLITAKWNV